jgi:hypothetical protein
MAEQFDSIFKGNTAINAVVDDTKLYKTTAKNDETI